MTEQQAPPINIEARLTALEHGLKHMQEIHTLRHEQMAQHMTMLTTRNCEQDTAIETLEEKMLTKVDGIYALLWSAMRWLGMLFGVTLLTIVLKAAGLY